MRRHLICSVVGVALVLACDRGPDAAVETADTVSANAAPAPGSSVVDSAGARDSVRGAVILAGTDPFGPLMVQTDDSARVVLDGPQIEMVRRAIGLDITAYGARANNAFRVAQFLVRGAAGEPAVDGTLDIANGVFFLRLADGSRVTIERIPPALRGELGSRVYLVGPLDRMPVAYGILDEAR